MYRRCRLEEIKLPLLAGNLRNVPMEEVGHIVPSFCDVADFRSHFHFQNLREEVAMDVDEDEEGSQQVKRVADYGIEVDFSSLDQEDLEVCSRRVLMVNSLISIPCRTVQKQSQTLSRGLQR